jgi:hypothetical protein
MFDKTIKDLLNTDEMSVKEIKKLLDSLGLLTWPSWTGFGVTTSWPDAKCKREVKIIELILTFLPEKDWAFVGPTLAAGGAMVVYAWPKSDPNYQTKYGKEPGAEGGSEGNNSPKNPSYSPTPNVDEVTPEEVVTAQSG